MKSKQNSNMRIDPLTLPKACLDAKKFVVDNVRMSKVGFCSAVATRNMQ